MNFLEILSKRIKSVSELEDGEDRDVVSNTVDVIVHIGKADLHEALNRELYEVINKELRQDIEKQGIKRIKTEINYSRYKFEINRLKMNLNLVNEKIAELEGETYNIIYSYEECDRGRAINDMIVCVK